MRAAPALNVIADRDGMWRWFVAAVAAAGGACLAIWLGDRLDLAPAHSAFGALVLALLGCGAAWRASRLVSLELRFDGARWSLLSAGNEWHGQALPAIDLGDWLLLRFEAEAGHARRAPRWLPLERRALPVQWHALRCAVYAPGRSVQSGAQGE